MKFIMPRSRTSFEKTGVAGVGLLFLFSTLVAADVEEKSPAEVREAAAERVRKKQVNKGILLLKEYLKHHRDAKTRRYLGRLINYNGNPDRAVEVLKAGLRDRRSDVQLLKSIASIRKQQAREGPGVDRKRGRAVYESGGSEEKEQAFKKKHYRLALGAYDRILKRTPRSTDVVLKKVGVLEKLGQIEQAAQVLEQHRKRLEEVGSESFLQTLADFRMRTGRLEAAAETSRQLLSVHSRNTKAHEVLATFFAKKGDTEKSRIHRQKQAFYKWLPEICDIEFSDRNFKTYTLLAIRESEKKDRKKQRKQRKQTIKKLLKQKNQRAYQFLAAACYDDFVSLTNRIYQKFKDEEATDVLTKMLKNPRDYRMITSAGHILARLKHRPSFPHLVRYLKRDHRLMPILDMADALAKLGDPRAVPHLIEVLDPEASPPSSESASDTGRIGWLSARYRAAFALGSFDTQESRKALKRGTKNQQIDLACYAALYKITKKEKYWNNIKEMLEEGTRSFQQIYVKSFLEQFEKPEIQSVFEELETSEEK